MITANIVTNGVLRSIDYKLWPNEVRVYTIRGDITDQEAIETMGQELAAEYNVEKVTIKL